MFAGQTIISKRQVSRFNYQQQRILKENFVKWGKSWDFPGGTVVKNPPANAGDMGSIPGLGRSQMPRSN